MLFITTTSLVYLGSVDYISFIFHFKVSQTKISSFIRCVFQIQDLHVILSFKSERTLKLKQRWWNLWHWIFYITALSFRAHFHHCKVFGGNACMKVPGTHHVEIHQERGQKEKNQCIFLLKFQKVTKCDEGV